MKLRKHVIDLLLRVYMMALVMKHCYCCFFLFALLFLFVCAVDFYYSGREQAWMFLLLVNVERNN